MKRLNFKYANNVRDIGGYQTNDGKETKYDTILRSDVIQIIEDDEINYLLNNNIRTIIDFREPEELNKKKNVFTNDNRFNYYNVILKGRYAPKLEKDIPKLYFEIACDKEKVKEVLKIIANSDTGCIINCNSGKDRTGVITMILLLICGAYDKDIIADYSVSDIYLEEELIKFHEDHPELPKFLGSSKSIYMKQTLDLFHKKFHTINDYLEYLELDNKTITRLRNKLLK